MHRNIAWFKEQVSNINGVEEVQIIQRSGEVKIRIITEKTTYGAIEDDFSKERMKWLIEDFKKKSGLGSVEFLDGGSLYNV